MIEVKVRGTPKKNHIWKGTCVDCESILHAQIGDLIELKDQKELMYWATCPVCREAVFFMRLAKKDSVALTDR